MRMLIWGFAGRTYHIVGNLMSRLISTDEKNAICVPFQVGPRQRNFKVKDKGEYEFKPEIIVSDITHIYLNLSNNEGFCKAVSGDGRSYSPELFPKAIHVLQKIGKPPGHISDFQTLHNKISVSNWSFDV